MLFNRRINFERALREIQETIVPAVRVEKAAALREMATAEIEREEASLRDLNTEAEGLALHPGRQAGAQLHARGKLILGVLLVVLDIPLQFALNAAGFPQVPLWIWAATAPAFAFGLGGIVHGAAASLYDPVRPARSIRLVRALAWITFGMASAAFSILMFIRVASPSAAASLMDLAGASTWILTETAPVAGGFFLAWWYFLCAPAEVAAKQRRGNERLGELRRLLEQLPTAADDGRPRTASAGMVRRIVTIGVLASLWTAGGRPALAQSSDCGVAVDVTRSVDSTHRAAALKEVAASVGDMVAAFRCQSMVVLWYADEGAWAPRRYLVVPVPPSARACTSVTKQQRGTDRLLASFSAYGEIFARDSARACDSTSSARNANYQRDWEGFLGEFSRVLAYIALGSSATTDIVSAVNGMEARVVFNFTDGVDHSRSNGAAHKSRHILILIPSAPRYGGRLAADSAGAVWKARGVEVIPYPRLAVPGFWMNLASHPPDRSQRR